MGIASKIEWTDSTFNHVRGCTKISAGCTNCYADSLAKRNPNVLGIWGDQGTRVLASDAMWREPLKWNADAEKEGVRRRVFCASLSDVFEDWKGQVRDHKGNPLVINASGTVFHTRENCEPCYGERPYTLDDARQRLFRLIDATPNLDWQLLTKRPQNIRRMVPSKAGWARCATREKCTHPDCRMSYYRDNVWLGTSIATQQDAETNVPELLGCRDLSPVLFLSAEPLLGPISLDSGPKGGPPRWMSGEVDHADPRLDWIIVGGESGPKARECDVAWIRSISYQCCAAGVPVFMKQLGSLPRDTVGMDWPSHVRRLPNNAGELLGIRDRKGGDPDEWPKYLRVREFPTV